MYPSTMTANAAVATRAKMAIWMRICRVRIMSGPLVESVGSYQGVACGARTAGVARARELADGAAPLQFQPGQVAFPPRSGEDSLVDAAQREVKEQRQVRVVAAHPVGQRLLRERESRQEAQRAGQRRTSVGQ